MKDTSVDYAWATFDYIRFSTTRTAASKGIYFSRSIDLGAAPSAAGTIAWTQTVPPGGSLDLCTRTSSDGVTWGGWSSPYATPAGSTITSSLARYIQFSATLVEDSSLNTPRLDDVTITFPGIAPSTPVVSSTNYPDGVWSNKTVADLHWVEPAGNPAPVWAYYYAYELPVVTPSVTQLTAGAVIVSSTVTETNKLDFTEGRHTFHLAAQGEPVQYPLSQETIFHVLKDTIAPGAVTVVSPTHPTLAANGCDSPEFDLTAADAVSATTEVSGLAGYYYLLDTVPTTLTSTVATFSASNQVTYTGLSDGAYWFHACAADAAGNLGPVAHYPIVVSYKDRVHVTISSPTHPEGAESASPNPEFRLALSNPDSATIVGYHYVLDHNASTFPLTTDRLTTGTTIGYQGLANGSWWLHVSAKNETGTLCNPTHYGFSINFQSAVLDEQHVHAVPHPIKADLASIRYELAAPVQEVLAEFLDATGRKVDTVHGSTAPGFNTLTWDVRKRANGLYFLKLKVRGQDGKETVILKKLAVVR